MAEPQYTTLISRLDHLARPRDAANPSKQDGVVCKIRCECGKVYIWERKEDRSMNGLEGDIDIRLARTQTSAVSEDANKTGHYPPWDKVNAIDRDPNWYTRRVKRPFA